MNHFDKLAPIIARVIANTRRRKRPNNLLEIAEDIILLKEKMGSFNKVAEVVGISPGMLKKFLNVLKLSDYVINLVKERKIDSVTVVHLLAKFDHKKQKTLANEVINGKISPDIMKAIVPLSKKYPKMNLNILIDKAVNSKDYRVYILYFRLPISIHYSSGLKGYLGDIIGEDNIISFSVSKRIAKLKLTEKGSKYIRGSAQKKRLSLKKYINKILDEFSSREVPLNAG